MWNKGVPHLDSELFAHKTLPPECWIGAAARLPFSFVYKTPALPLQFSFILHFASPHTSTTSSAITPAPRPARPSSAHTRTPQSAHPCNPAKLNLHNHTTTAPPPSPSPHQPSPWYPPPPPAPPSPANPPQSEPVDPNTGLPPNWTVRYSKSKSLPYYFNTSTSTSQWEPPHSTDANLLKQYMSTTFTAPTPTPGSAPEGKIRAAHLLVKHCNSRRASSWKQAVITRTPEEAREILEGYQKRIEAGEVSLGELAASESDCSSARKRGDLGYFGRGEMQKEFEEAAFALEKGGRSGVVETASGLHLIER